MPTTAINAKTILQRTTVSSNDQTSIYWSVPEMIRYLNDGLREIALIRPELFTTTADVAAVAGPLQSIPATGVKLLDVPSNGTSAVPLDVVRKVEKRSLDNIDAGWMHKTPVALAIHWCPHESDVAKFWVYPPLIATSPLVVTFCDTPAGVDETTTATCITVDTVPETAIPMLKTIQANALCDYILYRMYSKDTQDAGNMARAGNHLTLFQNSMGVDKATTLALSQATRTQRAA